MVVFARTLGGNLAAFEQQASSQQTVVMQPQLKYTRIYVNAYVCKCILQDNVLHNVPPPERNVSDILGPVFQMLFKFIIDLTARQTLASALLFPFLPFSA